MFEIAETRAPQGSSQSVSKYLLTSILLTRIQINLLIHMRLLYYPLRLYNRHTALGLTHRHTQFESCAHART